jgi:hypothetical protein
MTKELKLMLAFFGLTYCNEKHPNRANYERWGEGVFHAYFIMRLEAYQAVKQRKEAEKVTQVLERIEVV